MQELSLKKLPKRNKTKAGENAIVNIAKNVEMLVNFCRNNKRSFLSEMHREERKMN